MPYEFFLPDLGEGVAEGEIAEWLVEVGQTIAEDDPMVEVETDKAAVEIPSPVDGVVLELHAAAGDRVAVGSLLITIETVGAAQSDGDQLPATGAPPSPTAARPASTAVVVKATPGARRLAKQSGIDLASVAGSGPRGAITEQDVRRAVEGGVREPSVNGRREPLRGVRRRIAERLTESHQQVPKVTVVEECDFTNLMARRNGLSMVPFVLEASVAALKAYPEFNASLEGNDIVFHDRYDIGVAVQGPKGLTVPVVRGVDQLSIEQVDERVRQLVEVVRNDEARPENLRGGTFTVTLAGKLGGFFATPLVNLGEAAIVGVHRISERPVVRSGEIVVRSIGLVSCSFDHRITDGTRATMFLLHLIDELQRDA